MISTLQDDDIPGIVRFRTYEVLKEEVANPRLRWAYLPYSMHMAGPREAIQHMIIRRNYGGFMPGTAGRLGAYTPLVELAVSLQSGLRQPV